MKVDHKILVRQQDQSDCGVACLLTIIRFHGGNASLEELRKLSGTSREGTTLLGLFHAATHLGFVAEGLEADSVSNLSELNEPAILHVVIKNGLQHYLVYFPQPNSQGKISVFDPAKGFAELSESALDGIWHSKALLKLVPNASFIKREVQKFQKRTWLLDLVREDVPILLLSMLLGIVISVLGVSTAIFSQKLIDNILPTGDSPKLWLSLFLVTMILLTRSGLSYLRGIFMVRQSRDFNNRIIQLFYKNLLALPKSFFDTRRIGDLIARMNDTRRIQTVLSILAGSVVIDFLMIAVSMVFLFVYSIEVGLIMLCILPVYVVILYKFNKPIVTAQKSVMVGYSLAESNFIDTMQGVGEVKITNKQSFFERINAQIFGQFQARVTELGNLQIRFVWVSEIWGVLFLMVVFGISSWLVLQKELTLGEMVALLGMAAGIVPSLNRLLAANIQLQEALVAFDRMFEFTSLEKEKMKGNIIREPIRQLVVEDVSFRFPGRKQILANVSFTIEVGEMVALKGESGSGKSTLMQLLQKFYEPESGIIRANGQDLQSMDTEQWRERVGCVSQDVKIFNGTLLYNITLSDDPNDFEKAMAFCEQSGYGFYFQEFPQGYLTMLGEEGINISGGQKQLLAIARALFRNPEIFILDEATSAMDKKMEDFVLGILSAQKPNMIIVFITHRTDTAVACDRILQLQSGTLLAR